MLGICGAPGAGKSTIATWIVEQRNLLASGSTVLVPMDGYHFSNDKLQEIGLLPLKGIPETFDAERFIAKLSDIRTLPTQTHFCPRFERSIEASIENAIEVKPDHKLIVVEGNYLLLERAPWSRMRELFDEIWMLEADEELILPRLLQRHMQGGNSAEGAQAKVNSTDMPNARLVIASKNRAHRTFDARQLCSDETAGSD